MINKKHISYKCHDRVKFHGMVMWRCCQWYEKSEMWQCSYVVLDLKLLPPSHNRRILTFYAIFIFILKEKDNITKLFLLVFF